VVEILVLVLNICVNPRNLRMNSASRRLGGENSCQFVKFVSELRPLRVLRATIFVLIRQPAVINWQSGMMDKSNPLNDSVNQVSRLPRGHEQRLEITNPAWQMSKNNRPLAGRMSVSLRTGAWLLAVLLGVMAWLGAARAAEPTDPTQQYVGICIDDFFYWDHSHALADLQGHAEYLNFSWGPAIVDTNGWPLQDALVLVSSDALATGDYKIMLQGQAQISYTSAGTITNLTYNPTNNETTADWVLASVATGNVWLDFTGTSRTNNGALNTGFTNLHIWRPGIPTDGSVMFTPEFLCAARKFCSFRGMGMVNANADPALHWADRSLMCWAGEPVDTTNNPWGILYSGTNTMYNGSATNTYWPGGFVSDRGRPWELLVLIANATTNDLWINVPVRVDDDYVTKLAQLIRYGSDGVNPYTNTQANPVYPPLNSNLKVYIEYGNEVWNTGPGFNNFNWEQDIVNGELLNTNSPICYDGVPDLYTGMFRYTAYRSSAISLIFRQVFGDAAMMTTVRPVLSSQAGNANQILQIGLQWADGFYSVVRTNNPVVRQVSDLWYGGGGAAYYDSTVTPFVLVTNSGVVTATTTPDLMTEYFAGLPNTNFALSTATDATWTKAYGLKLTSYEGGPGPGGSALGSISGDAVSPLYDADPRMQGCMVTAQNQWIANGGDLLTYYVLAGDGPWGFGDSTNTVMTTNTVKLLTIDLIRSQAKTNITLGTQIPAVIPVANNPAAAIIQTGGYVDPNAGTANLSANADPAQSDALLIPMYTTNAGIYKFQLGYETAAAATVELLLNGQSAGIWTLSASGSIIPSSQIATNLPAGLTVARVRVLSGNPAILNLTVLNNYTVDVPAFSPAGGTYTDTQSITISSTNPGASICYTTDGSTPSPAHGTLYTAPVILFTSATINAMATAPGYTNSPVGSASYTINNLNYGALVAWDFFAASGNAATDGSAASVGSTYNAGGVQAGTLTRGAGLPASPLQAYPGLGAMNTLDWTDANLAAAKADGSYFQFTVAPLSGSTLSLSSLSYVAYQQNAHSTATIVVEYSTNGFATSGIPVGTNSSIQSGWEGNPNTIALSAIGALQNVAVPMSFRLWGYGFGGYEDKGLGEVAGDNLDLAVFGTAASPKPSLGLQKNGANFQLTWPQGTLLQADEITGPWTTDLVTAPCVVTPSTPQKFYRIRVP
jgi:hypothetical protein